MPHIRAVEEFTYNSLNQLTGYESITSQYNNRAGLSAEYEYMANGYRLSKTVNALETRYLWDGDNITSELNDENAITQNYYRGYNLICDDSDIYYMHDIHGNVIETYDGTSKYCDNWYIYNAYGTTKYFDDTDSLNETGKWGYCDQLYDFETGNYYMRARYYNPESGRFISEDPIKDGINWYAYCGGNPVVFVDINGLDKTRMLDVPKIQQKYENDCWAAVLSMTIAYETNNTIDRQDEIVRIVEGIEGDIIDDNVSAKEWKTINNALGSVAVNAEKYESGTEPIEYKNFKGAPVMENQNITGGGLRGLIIEKVDKGHPVIVLYNSAGQGHYIVVTGYDIKGGNMTVYYNDPAYEGDGIRRSASIDEMKSMLPGTNFNFNSAYSVRNNVERTE